MVKNPPAKTGDVGSILGQEDLGVGNGNLLHFSCLGNPMDRGTWGGGGGYSPWGCKDLATKQQYQQEILVEQQNGL